MSKFKPKFKKGDNESHWTLDQALEYVRDFEENINPLGLHCGITGSVLYDGKSNKDLDIIVYPRDLKTFEGWDNIRVKLDEIMKPTGKYQCNDLPESYRDGKMVDVMYIGNKRIDIFFLR